MARLTGALFSLAASGTIAETLTFAKWKGIQYVRTRVIPANPRSVAQQAVRGVFTTLNEMWKRMPALGREPFAANADGQPYTDRNKHIGENVVPLRDDAGFDNYVWSVQGGAALPPTVFTTGPGVGLINVLTLTIPTAPIGYTFLARVAAALLIGDPSTTGGIIRTMEAMDDPNAAGGFPIPGVPVGQYWTGGWIKWTRDADAQVFHSSFLVSGAVVT